MQDQNFTPEITAQRDSQERVQTKRKSAGTAHRASTTMMPAMRTAVVDSMRAGREPRNCAEEYNVSQSLCLWLWMRHEIRRINSRLEAVEDKVLPTTRLRMVA
jgi:hypothetical protein